MFIFLKKIVNKLASFFGFSVQRIQTSDYWVNDHEWNNVYKRKFPKSSLKNKAFYNIGAGNFTHWAWTNIDKKSDAYKHVQKDSFIDLDLFNFKSLPIDDETAEVIYTSHTIEHIDDYAAKKLFKEIKRVLKPEGTFRVVCPNIDLAYNAYKNGDRDYFYWQNYYSNPKEMLRSFYKKPLSEASLEQVFLSHFAFNASEIHLRGVNNPIGDDEFKKLINFYPKKDFLNKCISRCDLKIQKLYPNGHVNWWNNDKLIEFLKIAGFENIFRSAYGQSICPILRDIRLFDNTHPKFSMYIDAKK